LRVRDGFERAGILLCGLLCYVATPSLHWRFSALIGGIGALLILLSAMHWPGLNRELSRPLFAAAGRISFGIYALHFPVLLGTTFIGWQQGWPSWLPGLLCVAITIGLALLLSVVIEQPMIQWGRRIAEHIGGRKQSQLSVAPASPLS
jgi:peptidoglycan/LPS O-acetylase OafA/YrhL